MTKLTDKECTERAFARANTDLAKLPADMQTALAFAFFDFDELQQRNVRVFYGTPASIKEQLAAPDVLQYIANGFETYDDCAMSVFDVETLMQWRIEKDIERAINIACNRHEDQ